MKRIIDGLLYDTDDSVLIYEDVDKRRKYYQTANKRFFILYKTGEIYAATEEHVKAVLGERDIDKYIEIFGEPEEA